MTSFSKLWRNIEARLTAAFGILQVDAPASAPEGRSAFLECLAHNELELALDQLLRSVPESDPPLRRRFWEEAPAWLFADAEIVDYPPWGLVAKAEFRRKRR